MLQLYLDMVSSERKLTMPPNVKSLAVRLRDKCKRGFQEPEEAVNVGGGTWCMYFFAPQITSFEHNYRMCNIFTRSFTFLRVRNFELLKL
jgi:hypothetical protein